MSIVNINTWFSLKNDLFKPQLRGFVYASWINRYSSQNLLFSFFCRRSYAARMTFFPPCFFDRRFFFFIFHGEKFCTLVNCKVFSFSLTVVIFANFKKSSSLFLFSHFPRSSFSENLKSVAITGSHGSVLKRKAWAFALRELFRDLMTSRDMCLQTVRNTL